MPSDALTEFPITKELPDHRYMRHRDSKILLDDNGDAFFETYNFHQFEYSKDDAYHEVTSGEEGRLDLIAFQYYNNPAFWWVIAEANDIVFPMRDVFAGLVLRIPSINTVHS